MENNIVSYLKVIMEKIEKLSNPRDYYIFMRLLGCYNKNETEYIKIINKNKNKIITLIHPDKNKNSADSTICIQIFNCILSKFIKACEKSDINNILKKTNGFKDELFQNFNIENVYIIYNEILEEERIEKERLKRERIEKERLEKEKLEIERIEKERIEKERLEKERIESKKSIIEKLEEQRFRLLEPQRKREKIIESLYKMDQEEKKKRDSELSKLKREEEKKEKEKKLKIEKEKELERIEKEKIEKEKKREREIQLELEEEKKRIMHKKFNDLYGNDYFNFIERKRNKTEYNNLVRSIECKQFSTGKIELNEIKTSENKSKLNKENNPVSNIYYKNCSSHDDTSQKQSFFKVDDNAPILINKKRRPFQILEDYKFNKENNNNREKIINSNININNNNNKENINNTNSFDNNKLKNNNNNINILIEYYKQQSIKNKDNIKCGNGKINDKVLFRLSNTSEEYNIGTITGLKFGKIIDGIYDTPQANYCTIDDQTFTPILNNYYFVKKNNIYYKCILIDLKHTITNYKVYIIYLNLIYETNSIIKIKD